MTAEEFYDWMVFEQVEPFGEAADYLRTGILASTLANCHRSKEQQAFTPQDFMPPTFKPKVVPKDASAMKTIFQAIMAQQNAIVDLRQGKKKKKKHGRTPGA